MGDHLPNEIMDDILCHSEPTNFLLRFCFKGLLPAPVRHALGSYCTKDLRKLACEVDRLMVDVHDHPPQVPLLPETSPEHPSAPKESSAQEISFVSCPSQRIFPQHLDDCRDDCSFIQCHDDHRDDCRGDHCDDAIISATRHATGQEMAIWGSGIKWCDLRFFSMLLIIVEDTCSGKQSLLGWYRYRSMRSLSSSDRVCLCKSTDSSPTFLSAVIGSWIRVFGHTPLVLHLSGRKFHADVLCAEVDHPLLDADFVAKSCWWMCVIINLWIPLTLTLCQILCCTFSLSLSSACFYSSRSFLLHSLRLSCPHWIQVHLWPASVDLPWGLDPASYVQSEFESMVHMSIIHPLSSHWVSALHIVPKPNGGHVVTLVFHREVV